LQGGIKEMTLVIQRPLPPDYLTSEQREVWRKVLDDLPADWFRDSNLDLLASYCRHVIASRRVAQLIEIEEKSDAFSPSNYDLLLRMQNRESRALATMGTKLRLTQQALVARDKTKPRQTPGKKPWQE